MAELRCPYDCGATWSSHSDRRIERPLDERAKAAANRAVWTDCPHLTTGGSPRQITMERHDYWCRKKWVDAYLRALDDPPAETPPRPADSIEEPCTDAALAVRVVDHDGAPIAGATVDVFGVGTGLTDEGGYVDYGTVAAGEYEVTAEKDGYHGIPSTVRRVSKVAEVPAGRTTVVELTLETAARCAFDIDVELEDHSDDTTLTPFRVPDHDELASGTTKNQDYVKFELEIEKNKVDKLEIVISTGSGSSKTTVFREELAESFRTVGTHDWTWDGYSDRDVLDTKVLKDPGLELELRAELCGATKSTRIEFDNEPAEQDWVDIVIDRNTKTVTVDLRTNIQDGGDNGVGELPPAGARSSPGFSAIPAGDIRRQPHARTRSFAQLRSLVLSGLRKHWSRDATNGLSITTPDGPYTVDVDPRSVTSNAMDDIDVEYNTNDEWGRSSNPGSVRGIFSFFANIFVPERSIYNAGWIEYDFGWAYLSPGSDDADFEETSAHEIGHEILSAYGGEDYSYGHRGSSTVITQSRLDLGSGGVSYPARGEIDLMKYYHGARPTNFFSRVVASETDVKSLIWLARVEFDD